MIETWRPVEVNGEPFPYEVSDLGNVRSLRFMRNLKPMRTGCKRVSAQRSKVRLRTSPRLDVDVAVLVLTAFVSPRPGGYVAMHMNDDSTDNRLCNIRWASKSENVRDCINKTRGGFQLIDAGTAAIIQARRAAGEPGALLAREFGISQQRVCDIYKGRSVFTSAAK